MPSSVAEVPFDNPKPMRAHEAAWSRSGLTLMRRCLTSFQDPQRPAHAVMNSTLRMVVAVDLSKCSFLSQTPSSEARRQGLQRSPRLSRSNRSCSLTGIKLRQCLMSLRFRSEPLDIGYRSYHLARHELLEVEGHSSDVDRTELEQHLFDLRESSSADDASADDLLSEILLKQGYSLTEQIASGRGSRPRSALGGRWHRARLPERARQADTRAAALCRG